MLKQPIKEIIKRKITAEGNLKKVSKCSFVLLKAASFGKTSKDNLVNAGIAAEFFYQALYHHYWQGRGVGSDVIMGDYYGSLAIIYASKVKDTIVLETFCKSIQAATNEEDDNHKAASRLAKIYGASAYVGAYLGGIRGDSLEDFYSGGEKQGLEILLGDCHGLDKSSPRNDVIASELSTLRDIPSKKECPQTNKKRGNLNPIK